MSTPCCLISLIKSFSFIGLSTIPFTGGLFPLLNLTSVTKPGSMANSACTAAALKAITALFALSGRSSQDWKGRLEKRKAERPKIPKCIVLKESVCFPSLKEIP